MYKIAAALTQQSHSQSLAKALLVNALCTYATYTLSLALILHSWEIISKRIQAFVRPAAN